MSEELQIEGKTYISSKRASNSSGYTQDYIGQLARGGLIDAQRIGGLWYVSMDSLEAYKKNAENFKPEPPVRQEVPQEPSALVFFDGKEYLSAARAAEVTGYTQDYVGQLARSGTIISRQVGNRWYVEKSSILTHKQEKDALLAAVQAESVGLVRVEKDSGTEPKYQINTSHSGSEPILEYIPEKNDLLPAITKPEEPREETEPVRVGPWVEDEVQEDAPKSAHTIPIRRVRYEMPRYSALPVMEVKKPILASTTPKKSPTIFLLTGAVATIVIVLSLGYESVLRKNAVYAGNLDGNSSVAASAEAVLSKIGNFLEPFLTHELIYQRPDGE